MLEAQLKSAKHEENISFNRYLFARKDFRCLAKKCKNQAITDHYINVEKIKRINPRSYWKKIRLAKSQSQKLYTINNKTAIDEISEEFKPHFDELLNTPRITSIDNKESNEMLQNILKDLQNSSNNDFYVTENDVTSAILNLNTNKTNDPYAIKAEHYIHALSDHVTTIIAQLINNIMLSEILPASLATSHIVPIIKSYKKSVCDPNNYRGISIIPIMTKIVENVIVTKCPGLKNHKNVQFGFSADASTIHAELMIRETIAKYNHQNSPVYICSLDAEKAFDCCNWLQLFSQLINKNTVPRIVIRFLMNLYLSGKASVRCKNKKSGFFNL